MIESDRKEIEINFVEKNYEKNLLYQKNILPLHRI